MRYCFNVLYEDYFNFKSVNYLCYVDGIQEVVGTNYFYSYLHSAFTNLPQA